MNSILYLALIFLELLFLIGISIYLVFLIYSSLMGSPYVPTRTKLVLTILKIVKPNKKTRILELGCGDGRFLRVAAKKYHATGLGIDINPVVLLQARLFTLLQKVKGIEFKNRNIFKQPLVGFNLIYLFLMPKLLGKLAPSLKKDLKPSTLVISHGFKIPTCDKYITRKLEGDQFDTYFYRFPRRKSS